VTGQDAWQGVSGVGAFDPALIQAISPALLKMARY